MNEQKKVYAKLTEDEAVFACELGDKIKQIREPRVISIRTCKTSKSRPLNINLNWTR